MVSNVGGYQSGIGKDKLNKSGYSIAAQLGGVSTNASLSGKHSQQFFIWI